MNKLIRITPDLEKAKSILRMVETTSAMVKTIDIESFASNLTKEYYDMIRELMSIVLLLDGYKTFGDGTHKALINHLQDNYDLSSDEISLIDNLRITRHKIAYDGLFVSDRYLKRKLPSLNLIMNKLKRIIEEKIHPTL